MALECVRDMTQFVIWVGKTESRSDYFDWLPIAKFEKEKSFTSYWMKLDIQGLAPDTMSAIRSLFYHLFFFLFWCGVR